MLPLRYYKLSKKLRFRYSHLTSWQNYLWLFTTMSAISLFLCFLISSWGEIYSRNCWIKNYFYALANGFTGSYDNYIHSLYLNSISEAAIITSIVLIVLIVSMLLLRLILWILDSLCTVMSCCGQHLKRFIFQE